MANNNNFPSKIKIESPELQSVEESTKSIVNILTKHIQEIVKPLQILKELPKLIEDVQKTVTENFTNLFISNVETEVLARQADVKVIENKTTFVKEHIDKKKHHAKELIDIIKSDYKGYFDEIATEHELFSRRLDSHAYEIIEQMYPKQIQEKFSFQSLPSINFLSEHIANSAISRAICFNESVKKAEYEIDSFLTERNLFYSEIVENCNNSLSNGFYKIPFDFIEIEDIETNEVEVKLIYPWDETNEVDNISNSTLRELKEFALNKINSSKKAMKESKEYKLLCKNLQEVYELPIEGLERFKKDCPNLIVEE